MKKSRIQILIVLLILMIFPFLSWYYLRSGMDYRIEAIAELERMGNFEMEGTYDFRDRYIDPSLFEGKFVIAGIVPLELKDQELFASRFKGLIEQFSSRDEVLYLNIIQNSPHYSNQELANTLYNAYPGTVFNHLVLTYEPDAIENLSESWQIEDEEVSTAFNDYLFLIDRQGVILQAYDFKDENRVARLVEHLSMQFTGSQNRKDYSDAIRQKL
jgi:hypothetical protein